MKKVYSIATCMIAVFALLTVDASEARNERIQVTFGSPESYSDLVGVSEEDVESLFTSIQEAFNRYSEWTLSKDYRMEVIVRDIDLPGWIDQSEIDLPKERRFIDMYPPKIEFVYKVTDSSGNVIYEGYKRLIEYEYLDYLISRNQPDEYYQNLIASWSVEELRNIDIFNVA